MTFPINTKINPYLQQQTAMGMNSDSSANNNAVGMGINKPQLQNVNVDSVVDNSALKGLKSDEDDK